MQDSWRRKKTEEIQSFADGKDIRFHDALKTIYSPKSSGATTLLSATGALFSQIKMLSWKGGQNTLIVCSIDLHEDTIDRLPQI